MNNLWKCKCFWMILLFCNIFILFLFHVYRKTRLQGYNDIEISIRNLKTKEGYNIQKFILDYLHEESKGNRIWIWMN